MVKPSSSICHPRNLYINAKKKADGSVPIFPARRHTAVNNTNHCLPDLLRDEQKPIAHFRGTCRTRWFWWSAVGYCLWFLWVCISFRGRLGHRAHSFCRFLIPVLPFLWGRLRSDAGPICSPAVLERFGWNVPPPNHPALQTDFLLQQDLDPAV